MAQHIPLAIVSQSRLLREALAGRLADGDWIDLVSVAGSAHDLYGAARAATLGVVLLHATGDLAETSETIWDVRSRLPRAQVIVLARFASEGEILRCIEAGAVACLGDDSPYEVLCQTIQGVADGKAACPAALLGGVARRIRQLDASLHEPAPLCWDRLSAREAQVARLAASGLVNKQIARQLRLRPSTVKKHIHHAMDKLDVRRRELIRRAYQSGMDGMSGEGGAVGDARTSFRIGQDAFERSTVLSQVPSQKEST